MASLIGSTISSMVPCLFDHAIVLFLDRVAEEISRGQPMVGHSFVDLDLERRTCIGLARSLDPRDGANETWGWRSEESPTNAKPSSSSNHNRLDQWRAQWSQPELCTALSPREQRKESSLNNATWGSVSE